MEKLYGLIGFPLGHSHSPDIHHALGNDAYRLYELDKFGLIDFLSNDALGGVNITIPYKKFVLSFCDVLSEEVKEIGAANVLVNRNGLLYAYNTDRSGFLKMLDLKGIQVEDKNVLILGSGGASLAVVSALKERNPRFITVLSRSGEQKLQGNIAQDRYENIDKYIHSNLIINTTPVGMFPKNGTAPIRLDHFDQLEAVADIVYNPLRTELLMQAEGRGLICAGGLEMLVAQAISTHELFFDTKLEDEVFDQILQRLSSKCTNIVLCGMPGCGKTTIAKLLGEHFSCDVVDTDADIEAFAGMEIPEIFLREGENAFRIYEHHAIVNAGKKTGCVISVGGGAVTNGSNYGPLHQNGRIYCLQRELKNLATEGRPLSKDMGTLKKMQKDRQPYYERFADCFIDNNGTPEDTVKQILEDFCKNAY